MEKLLVIPMYDTLVLPDVRYQLGTNPFTKQEETRLAMDQGMVIFLPVRNPKEREKITDNDFYPLGVYAHVDDITETPVGAKLDAITKGKAKITSIKVTGDIIIAESEPQDELFDVTDEGENVLRESVMKIAKEITSNFRGGEIALHYLENCKTPNELISMCGHFLSLSAEEKYALLSAESFGIRARLITDYMLRFKNTLELQASLAKKHDESQTIVYKENAIKKQISELEEELEELRGTSADGNEDSYEKRIEALGIPQEARKSIEKDLKSLRRKQPNDHEYSVLTDYMEFVTGLVWKPDSPPPIDLKKARRILDRDHYGLDKVKERIIEHLAVMKLTGSQSGGILLLVGAPGTGKTSMGKSVAKALGRKYVRISLGGIRDEAEIRGHRRTYVGAMPGRIMDGISKAHAANPVIVLDEVDKLMSSLNGDPSGALLEVLDPEQNSTFTDHYMGVPYDLSNAFFICTANTEDTIPSPLLDRMEVIRLSGYTPVEKIKIAKRHLVKKALEKNGLKPAQLKLADRALEKIISEYTMEAGVRGLNKRIESIARKAAEKIAEGDAEKISVREKDVEEYLGNDRIHHDKILKNPVPGVATGLAFTQAGGEILFIETRAMAGSGQTIITGQLGDVMKESVSICMSLIKTKFAPDRPEFKERDIHIHVPAGAIPKDGPSAGVTIFTALCSLVTGLPVDAGLAMTGEVSLRGQVMPIGGLPEKLMAAQRAGTKRVLIPFENEKDLDDVPQETKDALEIITVKTIDDVISHALSIKLPKDVISTIPVSIDRGARVIPRA